MTKIIYLLIILVLLSLACLLVGITYKYCSLFKSWQLVLLNLVYLLVILLLIYAFLFLLLFGYNS